MGCGGRAKPAGEFTVRVGWTVVDVDRRTEKGAHRSDPPRAHRFKYGAGADDTCRLVTLWREYAGVSIRARLGKCADVCRTPSAGTRDLKSGCATSSEFTAGAQ